MIPTEVERQKAATNKQMILSRLYSDFGVTELVASGSYGHGTNIRDFSDIDYFAVTPVANLYDDSSTNLSQFKASLQKTFAHSMIGVRDPAVSISFVANGLFKHEIIPAYYVDSVNGNRVFKISDREGGWMKSSPTGHGAWVNGQNNRLDSKLKKLIRLMKAWNYLNDVGIRSFYLEMRTTERMQREMSIVYDIDMLNVFRHLRATALVDMNDPIGAGSRIPACSTSRKLYALSKIENAINSVEYARNLQSQNQFEAAYWIWDRLFCGKLPVIS